jgi:hypothetical protein
MDILRKRTSRGPRTPSTLVAYGMRRNALSLNPYKYAPAAERCQYAPRRPTSRATSGGCALHDDPAEFDGRNGPPFKALASTAVDEAQMIRRDRFIRSVLGSGWSELAGCDSVRQESTLVGASPPMDTQAPVGHRRRHASVPGARAVLRLARGGCTGDSEAEAVLLTTEDLPPGRTVDEDPRLWGVHARPAHRGSVFDRAQGNRQARLRPRSNGEPRSVAGSEDAGAVPSRIRLSSGLPLRGARGRSRV